MSYCGYCVHNTCTNFDGCFCDSEEVHLEAYSKAFSHCGHRINREEYFHTFTHLGGGIALEIKNHQLKNCSEEKKVPRTNRYFMFRAAYLGCL